MRDDGPTNPERPTRAEVDSAHVFTITGVLTVFTVIGIALARLVDPTSGYFTLSNTATVVLFLIPLHFVTSTFYLAARRLGSGARPARAVALLVPTPLLVAPALLGLNPDTTLLILGTCLAVGSLLAARLTRTGTSC